MYVVIWSPFRNSYLVLKAESAVHAVAGCERDRPSYAQKCPNTHRAMSFNSHNIAVTNTLPRTNTQTTNVSQGTHKRACL